MCYDYISDETILEETELPSKDHFYNSLRDSNISDADYDICKKVFELGNCSTLGDYLKIYNKMDVLLLADIFLTWRNSFFSIYGLDISQYLTISSFCLDAFLYKESKNNLQIELLNKNHEKLINIINNNIRGGYCCVNKHFDTFDNPYTLNDKEKIYKLLKN